MTFSKTTIAAMASLFIGSSLATGPPAGCFQTATGGVGFCICTTAVPTTAISTATVTETLPTTTVTTLTITTDYTTTYVTGTPVSTTEIVSSTLRGDTCFPSSPASPPSVKRRAMMVKA